MRRILIVLAASCVSLALAVPVALADSPHFIRATGTVNSDGSLTVNFKEAGLGTNQNIDYLLSGQGTAIYVCVNRGGANPSASNKTAVAGPVSATGTFNSGKNGQVTASLTRRLPSSRRSRTSAARRVRAKSSHRFRTRVWCCPIPQTTSAFPSATSRPGACCRTCAERARKTGRAEPEPVVRP
jgi:hypothetical protein